METEERIEEETEFYKRQGLDRFKARQLATLEVLNRELGDLGSDEKKTLNELRAELIVLIENRQEG